MLNEPSQLLLSEITINLLTLTEPLPFAEESKKQIDELLKRVAAVQGKFLIFFHFNFEMCFRSVTESCMQPRKRR